MQIDGPPAVETLNADQLARRQSIVHAALRALTNSDYERVKISQVARQSGVALGTLYRYFASKEHLFAAVYLEWQDLLKTKVERSAPRGATEADRLRDVFDRVIRAFQLQPQFFGVLLMLQTTTDPYANEIFQDSDGLYQDIVYSVFDGPADTDRTAIVATISAVIYGGLTSWAMQRSTIKDVRTQLDATIRLIYEYCPEH